jgi:lipopolysaccharide/colanic/teichoic acid biosynthesis glycosyltransferase/acetyltransferase-like isoleucine patch superfamily enzyme
MSSEPGRRMTDVPLTAAEGVIAGHPASRGSTGPLIVGEGALLRSGTVLYEGSIIGQRLQTGHGVVIREGCTIGDDVSVWSNSVVDYGCHIGSRVKIHCNCYLAQYTELEDDVFLAPGVTTANDLYPGDERSASLMAGPRIGSGAQIGVNVTILPYVRIGAGALIGAGSVVTRDIPAGVVAYGNPAAVRRSVAELPAVSDRVAEETQSASRFRLVNGSSEQRTGSATGTAPGYRRAAVAGPDDAMTRALDIVLSLAAMTIAGPLLAVLWFLVWSSSAGPGIFRQQRVGRHGRPFTMLKLRTMLVGNDDSQHRDYVASLVRDGDLVTRGGGELLKLDADPRITRVGAFLRKTSLDELPQLINVLRGDMSLVGPRPVLPWEAELFSPVDQLRFAVKPGITGLWQVSGRSKLSWRQALDLDAEWVRDRSLRLYLCILLRTVPALLRGEAA